MFVGLDDRDRKTLEMQYRIRERLPREHLAQVTSISHPSSDGLEIPAYMTLPKGVPAKNLPLVLFPHGGPWARDSWGYNPYAQFLANRGYALLQPNFRASTGFGKEFLNAGRGQWGELMQDDLTWGVKHLAGRYQPELPPEAEKRLGEITVDPKTVTLQKAPDAAAVGWSSVRRP